MGQRLGKTTWPKPARGYRTITGGRYGRRHSYVGFRPFLNNRDRDVPQQNDDCKQLESDDVQKDNSLCMYISLCMCHLIANWDAWGWRRKAH